ncbi:polysaccharide pyruvyl transferase family protein [Gimesia fumaroli]|uniref:Polysaccharide pyruvyl transferase n=1 Tax=Gimesia fumaroli TaxID=2527976 RepID=A0A518IAE4_9PLAN|nr:polysaccharide pyruvyl transferase family protein [Gimesia fumaroli]QDV50064.1 Polysaccharide pyruvyl transferase [Gimesia fumaroli]
MHKYFLLTPVSQDAHTNPGSNLITDGIKHLISKADPEAVFFNVNMLRHDEAIWRYVREAADVVVFCGNPRFNVTEETEYWDWDVWDVLKSIRKENILIADLWAGASFTEASHRSAAERASTFVSGVFSKPASEMASEILKLRKTKAILEYEQDVDLKIARDQVAYELLKQSGENAHLLPCSSWWAQAYHQVEPQPKNYHCITVADLHIGEWAPLLPAVKKLQSQLSQDKPTYVLAHALREYQWIRSRCPELENVVCIYNHKDLLNFYGKVDKLVSCRLHASIPALSLGAQVCHLATDSRALTLREFGVEATPFTRIAEPDFKPEFQTTSGPDSVSTFVDLFTDRIVNRISSRKSHSMTKSSNPITFHHGLGDSTYFAHSLPLYTKRGHKPRIYCTPDKQILYQPTGVEVITTPEKNSLHHGWDHAPSTRELHPWSINKAGFNLGRGPMPAIGKTEELWDEYCATKLDITPYLSDESRDHVASLIEDLPKPLILLHTMGNTSPGYKNLSPDVTTELYQQLLDRTDGTIILLDWDNRVPRLNNYRIRHLRDDLHLLNLEELLILMTMSDLFVGVDSGPLHLTRYTDIPTVGVWTHNFPSHFTLPRNKTLNMVLRSRAKNRTRHLRIPYNIVEQTTGDEYDAAQLAEMCVRMLSAPRYLSEEKIAADVQLQQFVDEFERGVAGGVSTFADRHRGFDVLFREIKKRFSAPNIVETGTIRAEEDWAGAGFSTYLFGAFCSRYGGKIASVDLNGGNCQFARAWTRIFKEVVEIHHAHSSDFLKSLPDQSIDVLYQDSVDTEIPTHAQDCLTELKVAYPKLHDQSIIAYDDSPWSKGAFRGKGEFAIPWLLERGWQIIYAGYQVVLCKAATMQNE